MKRNQKYHQEKYLRSLLQRQNDIRSEIYDQPLVELETPIQRGWYTYIDFREDILRRKDIDRIKEAVSVGFKSFGPYIRDVKHVRMIRKGIYSYEYRCKFTNQKIFKSFWPERKRIYLENLQLPEKYEHLNKYFETWFSIDLKKRKAFKIIDIPEYYYKLKTKAYWITHIRELNPSLESEYTKISDKIEHARAWTKVHGRYRDYGWNYRETKRRAKEKSEFNKVKRSYGL